MTEINSMNVETKMERVFNLRDNLDDILKSRYLLLKRVVPESSLVFYKKPLWSYDILESSENMEVEELYYVKHLLENESDLKNFIEISRDWHKKLMEKYKKNTGIYGNLTDLVVEKENKVEEESLLIEVMPTYTLSLNKQTGIINLKNNVILVAKSNSPYHALEGSLSATGRNLFNFDIHPEKDSAMVNVSTLNLDKSERHTETFVFGVDKNLKVDSNTDKFYEDLELFGNKSSFKLSLINDEIKELLSLILAQIEKYYN